MAEKVRIKQVRVRDTFHGQEIIIDLADDAHFAFQVDSDDTATALARKLTMIGQKLITYDCMELPQRKLMLKS